MSTSQNPKHQSADGQQTPSAKPQETTESQAASREATAAKAATPKAAAPKAAATAKHAPTSAPATSRPRKASAGAQPPRRNPQDARRAPAEQVASRGVPAKTQPRRIQTQSQTQAQAQAQAQAAQAARDKRAKRNKRIIIGVVVAIALFVAGAALYYSHLNELMRTRDEELLASLKEQGSEDSFYMLLLGVDKGEERYETEGEDSSNYRSDTIILCRIAPAEVKATLISVHRDLMVTLQNGTQGKINSAYSLDGPAGMVDAVSNLAGVDINHYVEIDFDSFMNIVDAVGGVEVTLPVDVYDPDFTELNLKAGTHTLNGHDALMLCRARHAYDAYGDGDLYRAANQRTVISAILRKVLSSDPSTMIAAVTSMAKSVTTDLDLNAILTIAAQMREFNTDEDLYTGMTPSEGELIDGVWYETLNEPLWQAMMRRVDQGLPPYESESEDLTAGIAGTASADGVSASTSAVSGSSTTKPALSGDFADVVVTIMGADNGDPTFLAEELKSEGINAYASEASEFIFNQSIVVYDDPQYEDEAALIATLLGYDYVLNDGSYYMPTAILVRVASGPSQDYVDYDYSEAPAYEPPAYDEYATFDEYATDEYY